MGDRKRVLVLASTFPRWDRDTVPPFIYYLSAGLADRGYEMHVLTPHAAGAASEEQMGPVTVHRFRYAPQKMESLAYGGGILENLRRNKARWTLVPPFLAAQGVALLRLQRRYSFDLAHVHWIVPQGLTAGLLRRWVRPPMLLTAHGGDLFASRGRLRKSIVRFASKRYDAITVNSTVMQARLEQITGTRADIIPMGVDVERFKAVAESPKHARNVPTVLFVGRLAEKKGVEYLVRAMPQVRTAVRGARLVIVGDGPRRAMLEDEAKVAGIADAVSFEGARPNADLPAYYSAADVFVAPSVVASDGDTEALGVVLLEAAGCGLPIVTTRVGGIGDIVKNEESGLLVDQKSPEQVAQAVVRLLSDPATAVAMGERAREHILANFSWDAVTARFAQVYEDMIDGRQPGQNSLSSAA